MKILLSSLSLCIFLGLSHDAFAMGAETPTTEVRRNQYLRQAKAHRINYAEERESPKRDCDGENNESHLLLSVHEQPKHQRSVMNTRGCYLETDFPRLNLPRYRDEKCNDPYSYLQSSIDYRDRARALAEASKK